MSKALTTRKEPWMWEMEVRVAIGIGSVSITKIVSKMGMKGYTTVRKHLNSLIEKGKSLG